jgi:CRP-like cAMP-binding protein
VRLVGVRVSPGDIVGEGSLFSSDMRTAYVVAREATEVLVLTRAALDHVMPQHPRVRDEMGAFLCTSANDWRFAAEKRAHAGNKEYRAAVLKEFYDEVGMLCLLCDRRAHYWANLR